MEVPPLQLDSSQESGSSPEQSRVMAFEHHLGDLSQYDLASQTDSLSTGRFDMHDQAIENDDSAVAGIVAELSKEFASGNLSMEARGPGGIADVDIGNYKKAYNASSSGQYAETCSATSDADWKSNDSESLTPRSGVVGNDADSARNSSRISDGDGGGIAQNGNYGYVTPIVSTRGDFDANVDKFISHDEWRRREVKDQDDGFDVESFSLDSGSLSNFDVGTTASDEAPVIGLDDVTIEGGFLATELLTKEAKMDYSMMSEGRVGADPVDYMAVHDRQKLIASIGDDANRCLMSMNVENIASLEERAVIQKQESVLPVNTDGKVDNNIASKFCHENVDTVDGSHTKDLSDYNYTLPLDAARTVDKATVVSSDSGHMTEDATIDDQLTVATLMDSYNEQFSQLRNLPIVNEPDGSSSEGPLTDILSDTGDHLLDNSEAFHDQIELLSSCFSFKATLDPPSISLRDVSSQSVDNHLENISEGSLIGNRNDYEKSSISDWLENVPTLNLLDYDTLSQDISEIQQGLHRSVLGNSELITNCTHEVEGNNKLLGSFVEEGDNLERFDGGNESSVVEDTGLSSLLGSDAEIEKNTAMMGLGMESVMSKAADAGDLCIASHFTGEDFVRGEANDDSKTGLAEKNYDVMTGNLGKYDTVTDISGTHHDNISLVQKMNSVLCSVPKPKDQVRDILNKISLDEDVLMKKITESGNYVSTDLSDVAMKSPASNFTSDSSLLSLPTELKVHSGGSAFDAYSHIETFVSSQLEKIQAKQFDQSIELRTPMRHKINDELKLYGVNRPSVNNMISDEAISFYTDGKDTNYRVSANFTADSSKINKFLNEQKPIMYNDGNTRLVDTDLFKRIEERLLKSKIPLSSSYSHANTNWSANAISTDDMPIIEGQQSAILNVCSSQVLGDGCDPVLSHQQASLMPSMMGNNVLLAASHSPRCHTSPTMDAFGGKMSSSANPTSDNASSEAGTLSPSDTDSYGQLARRLRPYRPAGSKEMYYTESETDDKLSVAESGTTMESSHVGRHSLQHYGKRRGSDDAVPPEFPPQAYGSRKAPSASTLGIYSRCDGHNNDDKLSTIEEKSISDERESLGILASSCAERIGTQLAPVPGCPSSSEHSQILKLSKDVRNEVSELIEKNKDRSEAVRSAFSSSSFDEIALQRRIADSSLAGVYTDQKSRPLESDPPVINIKGHAESLVHTDSKSVGNNDGIERNHHNDPVVPLFSCEMTRENKTIEQRTIGEAENDSETRNMTTTYDVDTGITKQQRTAEKGDNANSSPRVSHTCTDEVKNIIGLISDTTCYSADRKHPYHPVANGLAERMNRYTNSSHHSSQYGKDELIAVKSEDARKYRKMDSLDSLRRPAEIELQSASSYQALPKSAIMPINTDRELPSNLNEMWQSVIRSQTTSEVNKSHIDMVRDPSQHVIRQYITEQEMAKKERDSQAAQLMSLRAMERRSLDCDRGSVDIIDGSYSEVAGSEVYSSERSRDERGFRKCYDTSLRAYKKQLVYDSSDTLFSIPEDGTEVSESNESMTSSRRIDPNLVKLQWKIKQQREKHEKQKRKERARLIKIHKLEQLLSAKRRGNISGVVLHACLEELSTDSTEMSSSIPSTGQSVSNESSDSTVVETSTITEESMIKRVDDMSTLSDSQSYVDSSGHLEISSHGKSHISDMGLEKGLDQVSTKNDVYEQALNSNRMQDGKFASPIKKAGFVKMFSPPRKPLKKAIPHHAVCQKNGHVANIKGDEWGKTSSPKRVVTDSKVASLKGHERVKSVSPKRRVANNKVASSKENKRVIGASPKGGFTDNVKKFNQSCDKKPSRIMNQDTNDIHDSIQAPPFETQTVKYDCSPYRFNNCTRKSKSKPKNGNENHSNVLEKLINEANILRGSRNFMSTGVQTSPKVEKFAKRKKYSRSKSPECYAQKVEDVQLDDDVTKEPPPRPVPVKAACSWYIPLDANEPTQPCHDLSDLEDVRDALTEPLDTVARDDLIEAGYRANYMTRDGVTVDQFRDYGMSKDIRNGQKRRDDSQLSLQEAMRLCKPSFIAHSLARQRSIALYMKELQICECLEEQRRIVQSHCDAGRSRRPKKPLVPRSVKLQPPSRRWSEPTDNKNTRLAKDLPQVVEKERAKKRLAEFRSNRIKARIFSAKVQQKLLEGK